LAFKISRASIEGRAYRVAADHYALNPTKVVLASKPWKGREEEVIIDEVVLRKALESAYDILDYLEKH